MRIDSSGGVNLSANSLGISFGGDTSSGSSRYLDDYEEGTFGGNGAGDILTPATGTVTCGTNGTLSYTKIGNTVFVRGRVIISAVSSPTGTLSLTLPFTAGDLTQHAGVAANGVYTYSVDWASGTQVCVVVNAGATTASILVSLDNGNAANVVPAVDDQYAFSFNYAI